MSAISTACRHTDQGFTAMRFTLLSNICCRHRSNNDKSALGSRTFAAMDLTYHECLTDSHGHDRFVKVQCGYKRKKDRYSLSGMSGSQNATSAPPLMISAERKTERSNGQYGFSIACVFDASSLFSWFYLRANLGLKATTRLAPS